MAEIIRDGTGSSFDARVDSDNRLHVNIGSVSISTNPLPISGNVQLFDSNIGPARLDDTTRNYVTISQEHHEIHEGGHYYVEGYTTLQSGNILKVGLTTQNSNKWAHFVWHISSNGILTTKLYENAGISGGESVTPLNNNRNSINTSTVIVKQGVSGTGGLIISQTSVGGTAFKSNFGGTSQRVDELILKSGTDYRREFISSSDENIVSFKASWYEHINN